MSKRYQIIFLLLMASLLGACSQWTVEPCMELTRLTPEIETLNQDQKEALVDNLDPITAQVLEIYPLWPGHTWIYEFLGYNDANEYIWRVTERVVDVEVINGYFLAKLERTATCQQGDTPDDFINAPQTGIFWYLVDGNHLYFFEEHYNLDLPNAWLDLVIPFPEAGQGWYPQPDFRGHREMGQIGFRQASEPYQEFLMGDGRYTCYNISTKAADAKIRQTFCETVGFLYKEYVYFNRDFGYRTELVCLAIQ